jgi:ribosome-associated protein
METIKQKIKDEQIKLDSLLKLSGITQTGGEAKILIQTGKVKLNEEICKIRGKKIKIGDRIKVEGKTLEVIGACTSNQSN